MTKHRHSGRTRLASAEPESSVFQSTRLPTWAVLNRSPHYLSWYRLRISGCDDSTDPRRIRCRSYPQQHRWGH